MTEKIFLIRNIAPDAYGGAELYQIQLGLVLKKNDYEPIIITNSKRLIFEARKNNINVIVPPYIKNQNWSSWRNLLLPYYFMRQKRNYFWYKRQIKKYKPVAIDIQSRDEWISATLAGRKTNTTVLWTDHVDFRNWVMQNIKCKYKNIIGKKILKLANIPKKILMISDYEKKFFEDNVKKIDNLLVMRNGVIDQSSEYRETEVLKNSFCYVGRVVREKGVYELCEAFCAAKKDCDDIILNIYGDGDEYVNLLEKYGKNNFIKFNGYTNDPLRAIAKNNSVILPSYNEGISMTLLQGAMLQKTLIASNVGGNSEIITNGKTGLLIEPKNISALTGAIKKIATNNQVAKNCAKNARREYEKKFSFEKIIEEIFIPIIRN